MLVKYSENNSAGYWRMSDKNWQDLETAGWTVDWYKNKENKLFHTNDSERFLGALASHASITGLHLREAVENWKVITNLDPLDPGCPCCGNPHSFSEYDDEDNEIDSGPHFEYTGSW